MEADSPTSWPSPAGADATGPTVDGAESGRLDLTGYVTAVRRRADLSQRELAERVGVSQSTVARWELDGPAPTVRVLERVLRVSGLRLAVVDEDGSVVPPLGHGGVRDNGGRRFPAHLDVVPPDRRPANRGAGPRHDRAPAQGWYALRPERDRAVAAGATRPDRHPTVAEIAARLRERSDAWRSRTAPLAQVPPCTCPEGCDERRTCPPSCECQCEPGGAGGRRDAWGVALE
jgi:HTH-type transcriptional regulator/antitoxin HipB